MWQLGREGDLQLITIRLIALEGSRLLALRRFNFVKTVIPLKSCETSSGFRGIVGVGVGVGIASGVGVGGGLYLGGSHALRMTMMHKTNRRIVKRS